MEQLRAVTAVTVIPALTIRLKIEPLSRRSDGYIVLGNTLSDRFFRSLSRKIKLVCELH